MHKNHLMCILKTSERCNINCSYCYFFNGGDNSYKNHPPIISEKVIIQFAIFLDNAIKDMNLSSIKIGFHGGEPLLQKKSNFEWCCDYLVKTLGNKVKLNFSIQTNGILLDEEWIKLLYKYNFEIGISIDGPQSIHDEFRLDHSGKGTYHKVKEKILLLQSQNTHSIPTALSVINPKISGQVAYNHLVHELGFKKLDFLLPDNNYDNPPLYDAEEYGKFMCEVFNSWEKNKQKIKVRFCINAVKQFLGKSSILYGAGKPSNSTLPLITISSNGNLAPLDELRTLNFIKNEYLDLYNIFNISLKDFLKTKVFYHIETAKKLDKKCYECQWQEQCYGGALINRFSSDNKFCNPSVYCDGLKQFYSLVSSCVSQKQKHVLSYE